MHRIRILHVMTSLGPGGAETNLLALLRHFDRDKFEHAVAFGGEGGALEKEYSEAGVKLVRLCPDPLGPRSLLKMRSLLRRIREYAPDIIHSHLDTPNLVGLAARQVLGCRLIIHLHGLGIIPHRQLPGRSYVHLFWNMMAHTYRHCDRVLAICAFQLPYLDRLGFSRDQITVIPNGINLHEHEMGSRQPRDDYCFVSVGRFFPEKDHESLIRAFQLVAQDVSFVRLRLVGDGPLRSSMEGLVASLDLQDRVEFMGVRRDIPDILGTSDCFILNSRWELHPITILEAMRAGLPVIASAVGGVGDTIVDGVTGNLVCPGDIDSLVEAMRTLVSDADLGRHMGHEGALRVAQKFDNKLVARQIESVYRDVFGM